MQDKIRTKYMLLETISMLHKTSHHKISQSLEYLRLASGVYQLLWNLTGVSVAWLPISKRYECFDIEYRRLESLRGLLIILLLSNGLHWKRRFNTDLTPYQSGLFTGTVGANHSCIEHIFQRQIDRTTQGSIKLQCNSNMINILQVKW